MTGANLPSAAQRRNDSASLDTAVVTVAVAHDNALVGDIVFRACSRRGLDVHNIAAGPGLLKTLATLRPAVLLVGDSVGGVPVEDVLGDILATEIRVIVVSEDADIDRMTARLSLGVSGYLLFDSSPTEIAVAVQAVARGAAALNHTVAAELIEQWRTLHAGSVAGGVPTNRVLTPRERDVLAAMADGLPTKAIAKRLGVAVKTVENHKIRIFEKLEVRTHAQAVTVAWTYGLVTNVSPTALNAREA